MGSRVKAMFKRRKKAAIGVALVLASIVPLRAFAWGDAWWLIPTQASNLALWAANKVENMAEMAASLTERLDSVNLMESSSLTALDGQAGEVGATLEKQTGAAGELSQAELNYRATTETSRALAEAQDKFEGAEDQGGMCEVAGQGERIGEVAAGSHLTGKAIATSLVNRDLSTPNAEGLRRNMQERHASAYCSDQDSLRGRCDPVDPTVQSDDLQAATLLAPSNGDTYNPQEAQGARDFIRMVAPPPSSSMLAPGLEKGKVGQDYLLTSRSGAARMSVSYNSLSQILAERLPDPDRESSDGGLSLLGLMRKAVYDKFVDPGWKTSLARMDANATLREIAVIMASKNFNTYQHYRQNERVEALLATRLSVESSISNGARIEKAKRAVVN